MNRHPAPVTKLVGDEISVLVQRLLETERHLVELTGGSVDAVVGPTGHSYLLQNAQERLQQSETQQRDSAAVQSSILNALPANIALTDRHGVILSVNDGWRHFADANALLDEGFTVGQNYVEICERAQNGCAEEAHQAAAGLRSVLDGSKKHFELEYPCHSPAEQRWFRLLVTPVDEARASGVVVMHINITERKLAEALMRESEEQLRAAHAQLRQLLEHSPAVLYALKVAGPDVIPYLVSENIKELLGFTVPETLHYEWWLGQLHPEDRNRAVASIAETLTQGTTLTEYRLRRKDAGYRWVEDKRRLIRDAADRPVEIVGVWADITERKRAEEVLRKADRRESGRGKARIIRDLVVILAISGLCYAAFGLTNILQVPFDEVVAKYQNHLDEAFGGLIVLLLGFLVFSYRRWREVKSRVSSHANIEEALRTLHGELEKRIQQRTADLAKANTALQIDITERKLVENTLRESEERFSGAFEHAPIGMALVAPDGRWLKVNRAICAIVGYSEGELLARTFQEITHPDDLATDLGYMHRLSAGEIRFYEMEKRYIHARGHFVTILLNVSAIRDGQGQPLYFIAQIQDITERKRTEARLRRIIDSDAQGVLFWNRTGEITGANDSFLQQMGYTREDLEAGRINWVAMTPPEYFDRDRRALEELAAYGVCTQFEKKFIRKDGTRLPILMAAASFDDNPNEGVAFIVDLTELKRSQAALAKEQAMFSSLVATIPDTIYFKDRKSRFVRINEALARIFGLRSIAEAVGKTDYDFHGKEHARKAHEDEQRIMQTGVPIVAIEEKEIWPDGRVTWASSTKVALRDADGHITGLVGISRDVTERRKLEEQFRQSQKMESIGTLAGGIAHDFNNILAAINGYTELARIKLKDNAEISGHLAVVLQAGKRASNLVRQILTFSRQEQSERRPIKLSPVVEECIELLRATIPSTIQFDAALATDAPTVLADATQIHQILMNLGTNAWHAMKDRPGRLQITLEKCVVDEAYAATQSRLRTGVYARVSVSDTGSGMDRATQRRIFEPFFTTKAPGEGTGLGLSVVYGIMENHEGAITVYSQPGEGTVFHLYFPAQASDAIFAANEVGTVPRGHGEQILFVDDEEMLVGLGRQTLTQLGYVVEVATLPAAALALVRADPSRFALVISDQTMPGMSGLELAGELKKIRPGLPIILMSGYSRLLTPERIKEAGIHQLLLKPASIHALGAAVSAGLA